MKMRNKYIRFFISSTFADMTKERNLLQLLFDKIGKEYAAINWQVEMVDLRWGISQEAGLDNRTMQICKNEILRCQELSPRPNFIILLGNRYGWTPLPERIPKEKAEILQMDNSEKKLFLTWYRLDDNILPNGEYVLQRRLPPYDNPSVWFDVVEYPLSRMFLRNQNKKKNSFFRSLFNQKSNIKNDPLFGISATEQEIQMGALSVTDAKDHVIGYIRNLTDIPIKIRETFFQEGYESQNALSNLKKNVKEKLAKQNVYEVGLSYSDYLATNYEQTFYDEMEVRIRRVIDNAITEFNNSVVANENEEHIRYAIEESHHFVGRADVLKDVENYINNREEHRPMWIKAHSGSGKTALMAKIVSDYYKTHRIICRFCGLTNSVTTVTGLFESLDKEIRTTKKYSEGYSGFDMYLLFKSFNPTENTIIIIDALNQLETGYFGFEKLRWLDVQLNKNVKVIVSSTDELRFSHTPSFLVKYSLPNMGIDAETLVLEIVHNIGRRLSLNQINDLRIVISKSDRSAIFLRMLGFYLSTIPSWCNIANTPSDLSSLVETIISNLSKPENHGCDFVRAVLYLFACERMGLSDDELLEILSNDERLYTLISQNSFHHLGDNTIHRIPQILWSRLRFDLQPFLRTQFTKGGQLNMIFHSELKSVIFKHVCNALKNEKEKELSSSSAYYDSWVKYGGATLSEIYFRKLLFNYYSKEALKSSNHALLEVIHCTTGAGMTSVASLFLKNNLDFLLLKNKKFPQELMTDFDELIISSSDKKERKQLADLKQAIATIPYGATEEQQLLYMCSLPTNTILYKLAAQNVNREQIMENIISEKEPRNPIIYAFSEIGELPCMSDDGTKIASLFQNRHEIRIEDINNIKDQKSIIRKKEISYLTCSKDMRILLFIYDGIYELYDLANNTTIKSILSENKAWASLSANGEMFAYGDVRGTFIYDLQNVSYKNKDMAQGVIKGTVYDEAGDPLIGVSIKVNNTPQKAITDLNGNFSIEAETNVILTVSYVGYITQNVKVKGTNYVIIELRKDNPIQSDTATINHGVQGKNDLIGVIASLKAQYKPMAGGALSPDGTYLWLLREDRTLFRINIMDDSLLRFDDLPFVNDKYEDINGQLYDPKTSIITCSEHCCICYHSTSTLRLYYTDDGMFNTISYPFYSNYGVVISKDEKLILYLRAPYSTLYKLERDKNVFISQSYCCPKCVSQDLSLALAGNNIMDFMRQMERLNISEGNVGGVNSLSVTSRGDKAIISAGRNDGMEHRKELLNIENGVQKMQIPPFINEDFQYIIASRISSDGSFYAVASHSSWSDSNELLLYTKERYISSVSTGNSGCLGLDISNDNKYVAAMRGNYIDTPEPKIFLLNKKGLLVFEIKTSLPRCTDNGIKLSVNNHFLLALGHKGFSVFDLISENPVDICGMEVIPYWKIEMEYQQFTPFIVTLPTPDLMTITNDITNNKILLLKLTTNEIKAIECSMHVIASSPSGRYVYFLDNSHHLYVSNYPFDKEMVFEPLLDHVQKVIPTFSDNFIYVISDDYTVLLYNFSAKKVEQKAYRGKTYFQAPCVKGLYVVNFEGDVALFKPSDNLKINTPAITTFVKRWDLESKKQERPSAMCPICAKQIDLPSYMEPHLIESPPVVKNSDWDNPKLSGHYCPYCNSELYFTPYII